MSHQVVEDLIDFYISAHPVTGALSPSLLYATVPPRIESSGFRLNRSPDNSIIAGAEKKKKRNPLFTFFLNNIQKEPNPRVLGSIMKNDEEFGILVYFVRWRRAS